MMGQEGSVHDATRRQRYKGRGAADVTEAERGREEPQIDSAEGTTQFKERMPSAWLCGCESTCMCAPVYVKFGVGLWP